MSEFKGTDVRETVSERTIAHMARRSVLIVTAFDSLEYKTIQLVHIKMIACYSQLTYRVSVAFLDS